MRSTEQQRKRRKESSITTVASALMDIGMRKVRYVRIGQSVKITWNEFVWRGMRPFVRVSGHWFKPNWIAEWKRRATQDPLRKRELVLRQQQTRLQNHIDRMVTAYQEELITLDELRQRMPNLRKQEHAVESELHSLEMTSEDQSRYLRLAETLSEFRGKLRARAQILDIAERRRILRLVVQEILVGRDTIQIRHSIPIADSVSGGSTSPGSPICSGTGTGFGKLSFV